MAAQCVAASQHVFDAVWVGQRHLADRKECRLGTEFVESVEDGFGDPGHWSVVKGQYDFFGVQERRFMVLLGVGAE